MRDFAKMEITRQEMERLGIAFRIRQGAKQILKMLNEYGYIPKRPRVEVGKKTSEKQHKDFLLNVIYTQCLNDTAFLESYLLGEEMVFFWGSETIKNKEYKTLKLVPKSRTKTITIEVNNDGATRT